MTSTRSVFCLSHTTSPKPKKVEVMESLHYSCIFLLCEFVCIGRSPCPHCLHHSCFAFSVSGVLHLIFTLHLGLSTIDSAMLHQILFATSYRYRRLFLLLSGLAAKSLGVDRRCFSLALRGVLAASALLFCFMLLEGSSCFSVIYMGFSFLDTFSTVSVLSFPFCLSRFNVFSVSLGIGCRCGGAYKMRLLCIDWRMHLCEVILLLLAFARLG
ncbi:hypothetical protein BJ508DRAFT_55961 [Ascobolus immersus RN42]|uniref:Uncharacterized protein n=1 Tax=Ascobolus immersus RN42 TaxID=1160509 RepID=A0A3N4IG19_ASCIM|nr:hypothetical protein BJ508DRAFT_55961 [Ascobolus immersus RN42]